MSCECHEYEQEKPRAAATKIIVSILLLILAFLLPVEGIPKMLAYAVPYLVIGGETLVSALKNICHGEIFDEEFLMSAATLCAFAIGEYPEAAGVMIFFQIGELFEHLATEKSRRSIAGLMDIRPDSAVLLRDGEEQSVPTENVHIGDVLRVKAGEKIPLDGMILSGETTLHTAALTGESVPVSKGIGDRVLSGSVNLSGVITMRVESEFAESTVSKILELVEHASEKKARSEAFITRFSRRYTPVVVIAAILLGIIPPLVFGQPWTEWLRRACIFLMVSCPCALVVSVPLSFFGGIGGASRAGILMKGASHLETLAGIDTVVFDKTGTLTCGVFDVTAIHPSRCSEMELLEIAAVAEQYATHPVADSILRAYGGKMDKNRIGETEELAGMGIHAKIDGRDYYVGNEKIMRKIGVSAKKCHRVGTVVHIACEDTYLGHIVISDKVKENAEDTIQNLRALGICKTVMLTGDLQAAAQETADTIGIDEIQAELLPTEKVAAVEKLLHDGNRIAFVGDGINDAPVLMRADLGVAMGALGSDAAMEAADVVLMDDKLSNLTEAIRISRKTMRIVRENIVLALTVKAVILVLSAFGMTNMWLAVFGDVGVLILAVCNALRCMGTVQATVQR